MGPCEGAVDEGLGDVELASLVQVIGKSMQHPLDRAVPAPALEATVTGLIGRVSLRQILPRCTGTKDPQDAVQYVARIAPRPTPASGSMRRGGHQDLKERPLSVG